MWSDEVRTKFKVSTRILLVRVARFRYEKIKRSEGEQIANLMFPELAPRPEFAIGGVTLIQATAAFKATMFTDMGQRTIREFNQAFTAFFNIDMVLADKDLSDHLVTRNRELASSIGTNYRRKFLQRIRATCAFFVEKGWIAKNPIARNGIPIPAEEVPEPDPYTWDEAQRIIAYFHEMAANDKRPPYRRERSGYDEIARYCELIATAGTRPAEALFLTVADVEDAHLVIHGKAKGKRRKNGESVPEVRRFPLELPQLAKGATKLEREIYLKRVAWIARIRSLLETQIQIAHAHPERNGRLFPWSWTETINRKLRDEGPAKKQDGTKGIGLRSNTDQSLRDLRKTALCYMRDEMDLDKQTFTELAGHSAAVSDRYYLQKQSNARIAAAIANPLRR